MVLRLTWNDWGSACKKDFLCASQTETWQPKERYVGLRIVKNGSSLSTPIRWKNSRNKTHRLSVFTGSTTLFDLARRGSCFRLSLRCPRAASLREPFCISRSWLPLAEQLCLRGPL